MIKLLTKELTFYEQELKFTLRINDKTAVVFYYVKNDPQFSEYDMEIEIKDKDNFTDVECEMIEEFITDQTTEVTNG